MGTNALPAWIQGMPGVCFCYIRGDFTPQSLQHGFTAVGKMLVVRTHGDTTKNYNYSVGVNSVGVTHIAGPYKGHGHYVVPGQTIEVNSLFGQTPVRSTNGA